MTLTSKAMLANLHIRQWTGRKFDRAANATVENTYKAQNGVGNYTKKLLPGAAELEDVQRAANSMRAFFYEQTLPWCADGSRILAAKNYLDFVSAFRVKREDFERSVSAFIAEYPALREAARAKLGDLFRETEYPTVAQLSHAFHCEIAFMPMPDVGDFRVEISESEKDAFIARMQDTERAAMRDAWQRMHDVVAKAAAKLADPKALFRDSLIENIRDICALMPKLNVTDDPALETMRQAVESVAARVSADTCRDNPNERSQAAQVLDDIASKMGAFMGGI